MPEVSVCGICAGSGERKVGFLPVTTMASGVPLQIPVHVLNGTKPGPKLCLVSTSHGDEIYTIELIRQILDRVDLKELAGTVVAIPCANPIAFEWQTRNTPIDMQNLNRVFPGNPRLWLSDQMAAVLAKIVNEMDCMIDWHSGLYNVAINYVLCKDVPGDLGRKVKELSLLYGLKIVYVGAIYEGAPASVGAITDYMYKLGKLAIVPEVGGGLPLSNSVMEDGIRGAFNVMKHLGMLPGKIELPPEQWIVRDRPEIRAKHGGIFYPEVGPEMLNRTVPKGTIMARIRNPLTLEVIEEINAPCKETLFIMLRGALSKVNPGDYAYIVAEMATAERVVNR